MYSEDIRKELSSQSKLRGLRLWLPVSKWQRTVFENLAQFLDSLRSNLVKVLLIIFEKVGQLDGILFPFAFEHDWKFGALLETQDLQMKDSWTNETEIRSQ